MAGKLKVTLVKSTIGAIPKHRATVEALGLKKLNKSVELPDNDAVRGMIWHVKHLVKGTILCKGSEYDLFPQILNLKCIADCFEHP